MAHSEIFTKHVEKAHSWLNQIRQHAGWEYLSMPATLAALRAVLHQLRDHLTVDQSAHLSAQLPLIVRGIYFENWDPSHLPLKDRNETLFLDAVRDNLHQYPELEAYCAVRGVFRVLSQNISEGERDKVIAALPKALRQLWLEVCAQTPPTTSTGSSPYLT